MKNRIALPITLVLLNLLVISCRPEQAATDYNIADEIPIEVSEDPIDPDEKNIGDDDGEGS